MPKVKLHPTNVLKLPALDGRRTDYRDDVLPGLVLRVSPTGARTFLVQYRRQGQKKRYVLGPTPPLQLAETREAAKRVLADLHLQGIDPHAARLEERQRVAAQPTVRELANRCLDAIQVRPATLGAYQRIVAGVIGPGLGHRPAAELRRAELRAFLEPIAKRTPVHANRVLAVLKRVYSWALEQDILEASPCAGIRPPGGREAPSGRVLSTDELRALLQALDALEGGMASVAAATRLLLLTGLRESAVLGLRRGDLVDADSAEPQLVVPPERPGTKARQGRGRAHVVPLAPAALTVVQARLEATKTDHLFPQARLNRDEPMFWNFKTAQILRYQVGLAWAAQHGLELPKKKGKVDVEAVRRLIPPLDRSQPAPHPRDAHAGAPAGGPGCRRPDPGPPAGGRLPGDGDLRPIGAVARAAGRAGGVGGLARTGEEGRGARSAGAPDGGCDLAIGRPGGAPGRGRRRRKPLTD